MGKWADRLRRLTAPLRLLRRMPRWLRWTVIVGGILLVLWLVVPVLSVASTGAQLFLSILEPLRTSTLGRTLLLIGVLAGIGALLAWALGPRWRRLRADAAIGRYLRAEEALLSGHARRGRRLLRWVSGYRGPLPEGLEDLPYRARLDLAMIALHGGLPERALELLGKVDTDQAPKAVAERAARLHAEALLRQGEVLPGAVADEFDAVLQATSDRPSLLASLAEARQKAGDGVAAARALERRVEALPPAARPAARHEADRAWEQAIEALFAADRRGDLDELLEERGRDAHGLVAGDLAAAPGDVEQALAHWHRCATPAALGRVAMLLRQRPGAIGIEALLRALPVRGTLLLAAAEFRRRGESDKAERAARQAWRCLRGSPMAAAAIADTLLAAGHFDEAEAVLGEGIGALVQPEGA